jgi:hypothetical protein
MHMNRVFAFVAAALIATPGAALAAQGRAGLWTITTTLQNSSFQVTPAFSATMLRTGLNLPTSGQTLVTQMCMTDEEVDNAMAPHMNMRDLDCTSRVVGQRGPVVRVEATCHGRREGVGRSQVTWRGNDHFEGTYMFKGRFSGHSAQVSTAFRADWVQADCHGIRAFVPQTN